MVLVITLFMAVLQLATGAQAAERDAALAVDAATGKIIFGRNIDAPRYPASLTKVMTLYILFQELRAGRMKLNSPIVMSKHAASMPPSKLGIAPGRSIRVDAAIRVLVTKSANDVAVAVAEAISGSETAFAARMTQVARSLGMSRTQFRNASGLPNPDQVTTARDLATLGLRIQRDFPEYYKYFGISSATVAGKTFRTHNRLIGKYRGTDGIKTGYINASGFNLLASVRRDGRHLVGVVMGGKTAASRNRAMTSMLDEAFKRVPARRNYSIAAYAGASPDREPAAGLVAAAPVPEKKPILAAAAPQPGQTATIASSAGPAQAQASTQNAAKPVVTSNTAAPTVAANAATPLTMAALVAATATDDIELAEEEESEMDEGDTGRNDAGWLIQVGAFPTESGAEQRLATVKATGLPPLRGKPGFTEMAQLDAQRSIFRARFSGFTQQSAREACRALSQKSIDCLALSPRD
ncbi:D-alanyl-D-alanine carboxypeptidase [Rhodoligotrophos defluvii]|uniref:D-alanyl-D-alanine carboxypeptidase n=1 Tax=Rhodoligotrophos defluvii TaxID=2561934 RepID=UPI00148556FE|nr:D-alanyl-D-alanine carboxypeptidase [Rhodoligotrophos defluvii]